MFKDPVNNSIYCRVLKPIMKSGIMKIVILVPIDICTFKSLLNYSKRRTVCKTDKYCYYHIYHKKVKFIEKKMSLESKLDSIMNRLSQNSKKLDETTKNIANATTRVTYELAKSQSVREKYNVPLEKYEQIIDFTQKLVDVCSNFVPPNAVSRDVGTRNDGDDALQFERFEAQALHQLEKNETEIVKLQSLRDVINQVTQQ